MIFQEKLQTLSFTGGPAAAAVVVVLRLLPMAECVDKPILNLGLKYDWKIEELCVVAAQVLVTLLLDGLVILFALKFLRNGRTRSSSPLARFFLSRRCAGTIATSIHVFVVPVALWSTRQRTCALSDNELSRLLEEVALWAITSRILVRPVVGFLHAVVTLRVNLCWSDVFRLAGRLRIVDGDNYFGVIAHLSEWRFAIDEVSDIALIKNAPRLESSVTGVVVAAPGTGAGSQFSV